MFYLDLYFMLLLFFFFGGGGEVIALDKISRKVEKNKAECIITRAEFHPEQRPLKLL